MKLNKLLFLFFALITFNSCAEYVDYGVKPEEPTNYNFKASLKATTAKYVGDEFEFMGTLNDVDVTESVKFKVNGNSILGKTYIPQNEGDYTVTASYEVAGLDPLTSTFKFKVLKKDETPEEPKGNRIEFEGKSYPISTAQWILDGPENTGGIPPNEYYIPGTEIRSTHWVLLMRDANFTTVFQLDILVALNSDNTIALPYSGTQIYLLSGSVTAALNKVLDISNLELKFESGTFNAETYIGATKFTGKAIGKDGASVNIYWDGPFRVEAHNLTEKKLEVNR